MLGNQKMAAVLGTGLLTGIREDVQKRELLGSDKYVDGTGDAERQEPGPIVDGC